MIVVADTSPLNYLVLLGQIEILAKIYARGKAGQTESVSGKRIRNCVSHVLSITYLKR
jgi:hypothetical protein